MDVKTLELPAHWTAGLQDERNRFLLQATWVRVPAPERAILPALVHQVTDTEALPDGKALAAVGDLRSKHDAATVKLFLTGTKAIQNPNACTWVMAYELAYVVKFSQFRPEIVRALRSMAKRHEQADKTLVDVLCGDTADLLAACVWGFLPEFRAFFVEFPRAYQQRWLAEGVLTAA
jgi:hypothetical protein